MDERDRMCVEMDEHLINLVARGMLVTGRHAIFAAATLDNGSGKPVHPDEPGAGGCVLIAYFAKNADEVMALRTAFSLVVGPPDGNPVDTFNITKDPRDP